MCEYQIGTVECRGDGYLWDADNDGFDPAEQENPCPCCNTAIFLNARKEDAETTSHWSAGAGAFFQEGTGVDIWKDAVAQARKWNPDGIDSALRQIGRVEALIADIEAPDGYRIETFHYAG